MSGCVLKYQLKFPSRLASVPASEPDESSEVASTSNATLNAPSHSTPLDRLSEEVDATAGVAHAPVASTSTFEIEELELQYPDEENDSNTLAPLQYPIDTSRDSPAGACIFSTVVMYLNVP